MSKLFERGKQMGRLFSTLLIGLLLLTILWGGYSIFNQPKTAQVAEVAQNDAANLAQTATDKASVPVNMVAESTNQLKNNAAQSAAEIASKAKEGIAVTTDKAAEIAMQAQQGLKATGDAALNVQGAKANLNKISEASQNVIASGAEGAKQASSHVKDAAETAKNKINDLMSGLKNKTEDALKTSSKAATVSPNLGEHWTLVGKGDKPNSWKYTLKPSGKLYVVTSSVTNNEKKTTVTDSLTGKVFAEFKTPVAH
jgi:hypothetical protein